MGGRPVRVGGAVIRVDEPVPRCVVTTLDPRHRASATSRR